MINWLRAQIGNIRGSSVVWITIYYKLSIYPMLSNIETWCSTKFIGTHSLRSTILTNVNTVSIPLKNRPTDGAYSGLRYIKSSFECYKMLVQQLDESTARRHLMSPRSPSGRSLHLTFQSHGQGQTWLSLRLSVLSICLLFILWQSNHLWLRYSRFQIWPWKSVKVMAKVKSDGHI